MLDTFKNHVEIIKLQKQLKRTENNINTIDENYVATEDQTEFPIAYETFDYTKDAVFVTSGRTSLSEGLDYTLVAGKVILTEGVPEGRTITIRILKNVRTEAVEPVTSGAYLEDGSVPLDKLGELPIPVSAGGTGATNAEEALTNLGGAKASGLTEHTENKDNPHNVTPYQIGAASNPNLLDNWYFGNPVNQSGEGKVVPKGCNYYDTAGGSIIGQTDKVYAVTQYSELWWQFTMNDVVYYAWYTDVVNGYIGAGYFIDRWMQEEADGAVIVNDGHVTMTGKVNQWLCKNYHQLLGKRCTFSVLFNDNFLKAITVTMKGVNELSVFMDCGAGTVQVYTNDEGRVGFYFVCTEEINVVACKAEFGSEQTLAHQDENGNWVLNEIPNYAEQMAICKQYDPVSGAYIGMNYIPDTGGMMNGSLKVHGGVLGNGALLLASGADDDSIHRRLVVNSKEYNPLATALIMWDNNGVNAVPYVLHGDHNKPSGTYTGANSTAEYVIHTGGIGNLLFISSAYAFGWVMPSGAVFFRGTSSYAYQITSGIKYENGVLTINASNNYFNSNGYEYTWQCV